MPLTLLQASPLPCVHLDAFHNLDAKEHLERAVCAAKIRETIRIPVTTR